MRTLREAWGVRIGLPATPWMLAIGAFLMRTETELVLKSRRVVPGRLTKHGFSFTFQTWPEAARALCRRCRTGTFPRGTAACYDASLWPFMLLVAASASHWLSLLVRPTSGARGPS